MMMMYMMSQMQRPHSSGHGEGGGQGNVIATSFDRYEIMQTRRYRVPRRVRTEFTEFARGVVRARKPGDQFSNYHFWEAIPFKQHRAVGRMSYILAELVEMGDEGATRDQILATACQGLKCAYQYGLDNGNWKAAWPLSCLPDPYKGPRFGGTASELAIVGGLLKAEADLEEKIRGPKGRKADLDEEDEDPDAEAARKEKGKAKAEARKKRQEEAAWKPKG
jgi:hypothetical protein